MPADAHDDALSWGDEGDSTHIESPVIETPIEEPDDSEPGISSTLLVTLGVFGGIFLLFIVGWIIASQRTTVPTTNAFFAFMYVLGEFLAIVSPAAWFVGVLVIARQRRVATRLLLMLVGVVILAPWPFILGIGAS